MAVSTTQFVTHSSPKTVSKRDGYPPLIVLFISISLCAAFYINSALAIEINKSSGQKPTGKASLLLKHSNIEKHLEALPGTLTGALQRGGQQTVAMPTSVINTLTEAVQVSFVVDEMQVKLLTEVEKQLTESELAKLIAWYSSDLGSKIVQAEANASRQESISRMLKNAQTLLADTRVLPYIREIDSAVQIADFTIRLQNLTQRAIFQASSIGLRPSDPVDVALFDQQWQDQAPQIQAATNQLMMLTYSYSFQTLTNKELERYTAFLKSPAAQKFNTIVQTEIETLFKASSQRMVQYVARKPKQNPLAY